MVKVELKSGDKVVDLYLDGYIKNNLDLGVKQLHDDFDQVWFVDGKEGAGKSDMTCQYAFYVNREDTRHTLMDRICFSPDEFDKAILKAINYEAVVYDEAFGGMSSSGTMSKINRVLQKRFTEIRAKNLFVFIVAPTFMDIMKYFAIWRSKCLLHVYLNKEQKRGFGAFYGDYAKRKLYLLGKKNFYNYSMVSPTFVFRFTKQLHKCVDKEIYDRKKGEVLVEQPKDSSRVHNKQIYMQQLNNILRMGKNIKRNEMARMLGLAPNTITKYLREINENSLENEEKSHILAQNIITT